MFLPAKDRARHFPIGLKIWFLIVRVLQPRLEGLRKAASAGGLSPGLCGVSWAINLDLCVYFYAFYFSVKAVQIDGRRSVFAVWQCFACSFITTYTC